MIVRNDNIVEATINDLPDYEVIYNEVFGPELLLDAVTGADLAFSLRKLKSSAYNCIRIMRQSDGLQVDIGFVNDFVDLQALRLFCADTNGTIVTWYDQSGNNRDIRVPPSYATTFNTYGPQIVKSGQIVTKLDLIAPDFNYVGRTMSSGLSYTQSSYGETEVCYFTVAYNGTSGDNRVLFDAPYQYDPNLPFGYRQFMFSPNATSLNMYNEVVDGYPINTTIPIDNKISVFARQKSNAYKMIVAGFTGSTTYTNTGESAYGKSKGLTLGDIQSTEFGTAWSWRGSIAEHIIFADNNMTDEQVNTVLNNQNLYYNIIN